MTGVDQLFISLQSATAVAATTTFDDTIYLTAFLSGRGSNFRPSHVVAGELLGFSCLLAISLIASQVLIHSVSPAVTGWLGVFPILVGISSLVAQLRKSDSAASDGDAGSDPVTASSLVWRTEGTPPSRSGLMAVFLDRRSYLVAAVAISNGSNNLAIYIPTFGNSSPGVCILTVAICYSAVAAWIVLSFHLTRLPGIAAILSRHANKIFPFVLMWLGFRILQFSGVITPN